MELLDRRVLREGIVAGLIGGAIVAVWFLVFDILAGAPLRTPALLGAAVFHALRDPGALQITASLVLRYTVLHGLAFIAFGILCAVLIAAADREPALLLAFVALFAVFQIFFLGLIGILARFLLGAILWWEIFAANLLASAGMLAYFFLGHRALGGALLGAWGSVIREGMVAGLIGAALVAVWFLAYDLFKGHPFRTPTLLGAAVFRGLIEPGMLERELGLILGYTVLHGLAFVLFGMIAALLVVAAERQPILIIGLFMLFAAFEVLFFGLVTILAQSLLGALVWWNIFVGNLLAAAGMLVYFFRGHQALSRRLTETWPAED